VGWALPTKKKKEGEGAGCARQKKRYLLTFFWKKESKTKKTNASGPWPLEDSLGRAKRNPTRKRFKKLRGI